MFKGMKLATKMVLGFGLLIIISAILGFIGWRSLTEVKMKIALTEGSNDSLAALNQCASYRKDFAIMGFTHYADEETGPVEKWQGAFASLTKQLEALETANDLSAADQQLIEDTLTELPIYKNAFNDQITSRQLRDEAFSDWGKVGGQITTAIASVITDVIAPERKDAQASQNNEEILKWVTLGDTLNEEVFQSFLLLRVKAVYLLATNANKEWLSYQQQLEVTQSMTDKWSKMTLGNHKLDSVAKDIKNYLSDYKLAGDQYHNGMEQQITANAAMLESATRIVNDINSLVDSLKTQMNSMMARTNVFMITLAICGIALGCVLATTITISIVKPINRIIAGLNEGAQQVASASGQVSAASQSLAEGATEQAAGLEETSSSLEEIGSMTKQNADHAQQANTLASEARKAANNGSISMDKMNKAINDIQRSSDETAKIIKVIDEIAFQTNLLALNAAVEAARAGEAGKGFAVVAEEVRNLAMRSADAAKNTSSMIQESVKNSTTGVDIANEVSKVLGEIVNGVGKTSDLVGEIATASEEQAQGISQVNTAVAQMDKVTQQNAANAEESASASEELSAQAEQMNDIVNELSTLVGGTAGQTINTGTAGRIRTGTAPRLNVTDSAFHQIAKPMAKREKVHAAQASTEQVIPLDGGNGFDDFNH